MINNPIIYKFFKDFTNHRKKTNRVVVFSCRPFPNILKYRDNTWDPPVIWKRRLLQTHIEQLKTLALQLYDPFLWMEFNCYKASEPLWGDSLLLTTKFPEIPGNHLIDLGRMKGWVNLETTQTTMYKISGSQFFQTTFGIQPGPETFD